ncbi:hypothetical protein [Halomonas llamarensis]|uniref:Uncharacterized protein n=1 Tax=Halomonas llamarensis TaxID=2945104 RepID=A0ABT0SL54_9GAMM|nr:hypothetical protein [Halomonas llamarensis]MCL7928539.1 hypothetical protein [Halomonas llamarensis]
MKTPIAVGGDGKAGHYNGNAHGFYRERDVLSLSKRLEPHQAHGNDRAGDE